MIEKGTKVAFRGATADCQYRPKNPGSLGVVLRVHKWADRTRDFEVQWSPREVYWHKLKNLKVLEEKEPIIITTSYA